MIEKIERRSFFRGREIIPLKGTPDEINENKKQLEKDRTHTKVVKRKYKKELGELTNIAKSFAFEELLFSEDTERPCVCPYFPNIVIIPDRYATNYSIIQRFVPENRLEEGVRAMFFHERLHSLGDAVKYKNTVGVEFRKEQRQLKEEIDIFQVKKDRAVGIKEILHLGIEEQILNEDARLMLERTSDYDNKEEIIVNRQLMKEAPNIDAIASLMLIDRMLSDGAAGARLELTSVRELHQKGPSFNRLAEEFMKHANKVFPYADIKTLKSLRNKYIEIGREILEGFDVWEKGRMKIVYRSTLNHI